MIRLAGLLSLILASPAPAADEGAAARDLPGFLKLFEGEFDNFLQVFQEKEAKAAQLHEHIHSVFKRVDLPALGDHVFYVEQYMDGDPAKTYRQRLYTFSVNPTEGAIELKIWSLPDEKNALGAHLDPTKLAGITATSAKAMPAGCEVYWAREGVGDRFLGSMKKDACRIASTRSGKTIIVSDDLVLDRDQIWIRDQAKDEQGGYVFGDRANVHHKLQRCHFFTGWTVIAKDGAPANGKPEDYIIARNLRWHDQGQRIDVTNGVKTWEVELAQLVYSGSQAPILKLTVYEKGNPVSPAYTWTNPEAERIGINLRWIQTGLVREATK